MKNKSNILVVSALVLLSVIWIGTPAFAQLAGFHPSHATVQPAVWVDWASFSTEDPTESRLEIYYKVYSFGLMFKPQGDKVVAEYELSISVEDDDGIPIETFSAEKSVMAASEEKARSKSDYRTSQANFIVPPGKYKVQFKLLDVFSGETFNQELDIKIKELEDNRPSFSNIEFVRHVEAAEGEASVFDKGELRVIPSVSRDYQGNEGSRLLFYLELYQGKEDVEKVTVETMIRSRNKGMIYRDTLTTEFGNPIERQLREISTAEFPPGDYEVELYLRGRRNKKLEFQRQEFKILWSQHALLRHDYKTAVGQLEIIADRDEIKRLKELKKLSKRIAAFNDFWLSRDPSVGTPENEVRNEFYRRVNYANLMFTYLRRDGWKSDRGRIYIKNGEPDQIDDHPMTSSYLPYQVWHYYKQGRYLRFLFVDEDLDGDYRLQYPYDGLGQRPDF